MAQVTRWRARLGLVAAVTFSLLCGLALVPTPQAAPSAASTPAADLTTQATTTQADLSAAAGRYQAVQQSITDLGTALTQAEADVQTAQAAVDAQRAVVGRYAAALYTAPPATRVPGLTLTAGDPAGTGDVLHLQSLTDQQAQDRDRQVRLAEQAQRDAEAAVQRVVVIQARIDAARAQATAELGTIRARTAILDTAVTAQLAGLSSANAQAGADQAGLAAWQGYLAELRAAGVNPPAAAELADPAHLPAGMSPLLDAAGDPVPGVAVAIVGGRPTTVVPAETVVAVSNAFSQLGRPYGHDRTGPDAYGCAGLVSAVWTQAGFAVPTAVADQWTQGRSVPTGTLQVGDLVFSADPTGRWSDVGIYLSPGTVIGASSATHQVGVRTLVTGPTAAVRVTLPGTGAANPAPVESAGVQTECGAPVPVPGPVDPAWGGYANGRVPDDQLCAIGAGQRLRCDAAAAWQSLAVAYRSWFGADLCLTDSYRSYAAQVDAHIRKPKITAVPGTSNHGWGLAVDFCGGINVAGTPQSEWMAANAGRFGWVHPSWAQPTGENPEPWHWEFGDLIS